MIPFDELREVFCAEVREQLEQILAQLDLPPAQWDLPRLFGLFHNVKGAASIVGAEEIRVLAHVAEDLLAIDEGESPPADVVALVRQGAKLLDELLSDTPPSTEQLFEYTEQAALLGSDVPLGRPEAAPGPEPTDAGERDTPEPKSTPAATSPTSPATLRVSAAKLDGLVGLAAEVVIQAMDGDGRAAQARGVLRRLQRVVADVPELRARLSEGARELAELCDRLTEASDRAHRISTELNATVQGLRMVRLDGLQGIFARVVRESCEATGKHARLEFAPGATELDRELLEQLRDALVHLLRNAVAHGIEEPELRERVGKPALGRITLTAHMAGPWVELAIADDGRGISAQQIGERAVEQGLIGVDELGRLSESERLALVFMARLSTQTTPNTIAGRGVGLDVVRSRVHACGGRIEIASTLGVGTRFELRVPLTRATTRGVIVQVGGQRYILPALYVDRVWLPETHDLARLDGREVVRIGGEMLDVTELRSSLGMAAQGVGRRPLVVLGHGHRRRAVVVDEVIEEREFVQQSLGWNLAAVPGVAGSAVLDGGDTLLVLDAPALIDGLASRGLGGLHEAASTRRRQILVVDDSVTSRTLEKNILASAGYEVLVAVDGVDAWRVLESEPIDLVISDVEMPNMDGLALTRKIRTVERHAALPVILVTSRGGPDDRLRGAEAGADAYVVKGAFDQDELLRAVARLL